VRWAPASPDSADSPPDGTRAAARREVTVTGGFALNLELRGVRTASERRAPERAPRSATSTRSATTLSPVFTPPAIGIHHFRVDYAGDTSCAPETDTGPGECFSTVHSSTTSSAPAVASITSVRASPTARPSLPTTARAAHRVALVLRVRADGVVVHHHRHAGRLVRRWSAGPDNTATADSASFTPTVDDWDKPGGAARPRAEGCVATKAQLRGRAGAKLSVRAVMGAAPRTTRTIALTHMPTGAALSLRRPSATPRRSSCAPATRSQGPDAQGLPRRR
jgi:hypothetical protein